MKLKFGTDLQNLKTNAKYLVCYQDSYKGNSKGFFVEIKKIKKCPEFWFRWNSGLEDRGIVEAYTTNDDVKSIVEKRRKLIQEINYLKFTTKTNPIPYIDGRFNKKTKPELFAKRDKVIEENKKILAKLKENVEQKEKELKSLPYYSSTLYYLQY